MPFEVGNAPGGVSYAAPLMDFRGIADLPMRYYTANEKQAEMRMRDAFPEGMPKDAAGNIDVSKTIDVGARTGGAQWVSPLLQMMIYSQGGTKGAETISDIDADVRGGGGGAPPAAGPPPGGAAAAPAAPGGAPAAPGGAPTRAIAANPANSAPTIRLMATESAGGKPVDEAIGATARELRINPDGPLTPQQVEQVTPVLRQKLAALQSGGTATDRSNANAGGGPPFAPMVPRNQQTTQTGGANQTAQASPPAAGGPEPQSPPRSPGEGPPASSRDPYGGLVPQGQSPRDVMDRLEKGIARARASATQLGGSGKPASATQMGKLADTYQERWNRIADAAIKMGELTNEEKNARASGFQSPAEAKRFEKIDEVRDAGLLKQMEAAQEAGGMNAQRRIQLYDVVSDALVRGNGKITTGPLAENALKVKQIWNDLFPKAKIESVDQAEIAMKAGFALAAETAKALTPRVTQMEFKLALQNNPGILLGTQGSLFLASLGKQMAQQDIDVAKLSTTIKDPRQWPEALDAYYKANPLISPLTGKPIGAEDAKILINPELNKPPVDLPGAGAPNTGGVAPEEAPKEAKKFANPQQLLDAVKNGSVNSGDTVVVEGDPEGERTVGESFIQKHRPRKQQ